MAKKILLSLAFAALVIMAFGAITSGAWFTDMDKSEVAEIKLGVLDPRVVADPFTVSNAAPGIAGPEQAIEIINDGEATLAIKYKITAAFDSGSGGLYNNLWVKVERPVWKENEWKRETVYSGWLKDMSIDPTNTALTSRLDVKEKHAYILTYTPDKALGNEYMGKTATFHLVLNATQVENPGW